ncbi:MAG: hypothetical protein RMK49_08705 [Abditibacteriales bacterium]|nr:hypothetical protein [Abditibacteriales bacterium]
MGAAHHVELGSSIRSAGAFGWGRLFVEDRQGVWFGCERALIAAGRAAARRARNPIHVIPTMRDPRYAFAEACVITLKHIGTPLHHAHLAQGPSQVIIFPDETAVALEREDWGRFAPDVRFVHLRVPAQEFVYHYRLIATITLAEVARQVGQPARPAPVRPSRQEPLYDRALKLLSESQGETVFL